jgi:hypothetical protein
VPVEAEELAQRRQQIDMPDELPHSPRRERAVGRVEDQPDVQLLVVDPPAVALVAVAAEALAVVARQDPEALARAARRLERRVQPRDLGVAKRIRPS